MKIIPESWSVGELSSFLSGALRHSLHASRTKKVEANVSRTVYLKVGILNTRAKSGKATSMKIIEQCSAIL